MNILHLISSGGMYGAETMLLNLAAAQKKLGCDPVIGVFHNTRNPHMEIAEGARARNLTVETIVCRGRIDAQTTKTIRDCVRRHETHLVHTHGWKSDMYGYFATKPLSVPQSLPAIFGRARPPRSACTSSSIRWFCGAWTG